MLARDRGGRAVAARRRTSRRRRQPVMYAVITVNPVCNRQPGAQMPNCFIIMPITTPPAFHTDYDGDANHFIHVLEHLFMPAVTAAGFEPIKPIMQGGELIQAEIIRRLETADTVLCDISRHNANVFFELGVRTALDRPAFLVKDDKTEGYPFDTSVLNTYSYASDLSPWILQTQIERLAAHIRSSHGGIRRKEQPLAILWAHPAWKSARSGKPR